jgi:hypothetical protein
VNTAEQLLREQLAKVHTQLAQQEAEAAAAAARQPEPEASHEEPEAGL